MLAPPSRMDNRGLSKEMLKPGTNVTVVGYANRGNPEEMRAERITVSRQDRRAPLASRADGERDP